MFNITVIGCGYWGPNLVRNFSSLCGCKVKKICDTNADRLKHVKSLYPGLEAVSEFDNVVEDPDKRDYIVSNEKIEKTGFEPKYSLEMGIRELIKGYTIITNNRYSNV